MFIQRFVRLPPVYVTYAVCLIRSFNVPKWYCVMYWSSTGEIDSICTEMDHHCTKVDMYRSGPLLCTVRNGHVLIWSYPSYTQHVVPPAEYAVMTSQQMCPIQSLSYFVSRLGRVLAGRLLKLLAVDCCFTVILHDHSSHTSDVRA